MSCKYRGHTQKRVRSVSLIKAWEAAGNLEVWCRRHSICVIWRTATEEMAQPWFKKTSRSMSRGPWQQTVWSPLPTMIPWGWNNSEWSWLHGSTMCEEGKARGAVWGALLNPEWPLSSHQLAETSLISVSAGTWMDSIHHSCPGSRA